MALEKALILTLSGKAEDAMGSLLVWVHRGLSVTASAHCSAVWSVHIVHGCADWISATIGPGRFLTPAIPTETDCCSGTGPNGFSVSDYRLVGRRLGWGTRGREGRAQSSDVAASQEIEGLVLTAVSRLELIPEAELPFILQLQSHDGLAQGAAVLGDNAQSGT
ncbi:hypothetical protein JZ751_024059 [Albula glossodonta]|uniref:Uncharacterized protein n=1 Tax=Albula glossodonta TaxID=121402 RepID=A0A8T2NIU9_9TELE|nr:hypothetical protein JZ751_006463 [Albula glossodonta]KAG9339200.1 hypothetical protein JZ751_024059 [Albula glossodonta]